MKIKIELTDEFNSFGSEQENIIVEFLQELGFDDEDIKIEVDNG